MPDHEPLAVQLVGEFVADQLRVELLPEVIVAGEIVNETTGLETVVPPALVPPVLVPVDVPDEPLVVPVELVLVPVDAAPLVDGLEVLDDELAELELSLEPVLDEVLEFVGLAPGAELETSTKFGLAAASAALISLVVPSGLSTNTLLDLVKPKPAIVMPNIPTMVIAKLTPTNFFSHIIIYFSLTFFS